MADLSSLLKQIPVGDIAQQLGIDEKVAEAAVEQIVPGLVAGLAANAADPARAASLTNAVSHDRGGVPTKVADVDIEDGKKIVTNVYGDKKDAVATQLAGATKASGVTDTIIQQILPIVAPIVLAWIANQFLGKKEEAPKEEASGGNVLGDLLGGLLGGGSSSSSSSSGGGLGGIGDLLGGLLGGGKK